MLKTFCITSDVSLINQASLSTHLKALNALRGHLYKVAH